MIVLWVLLGILLLLLALLCVPVRVRFDSEDGTTALSVHYLFLRFRVLPVKEKPEKEESPRRRRRRRAEKEEAKEKTLAADMVRTVLDLIKSSRWGLGLIRKNIVVTRLKLLISVGGADAAQAAESYGKLAAAIFPALGLLGQVFTVREPSVYIAPNFLSEESVYEISVRARILPLAALVALLHIGVKFLGSAAKRKRGKQTIKGGKQYERTTSPQ